MDCAVDRVDDYYQFVHQQGHQGGAMWAHSVSTSVIVAAVVVLVDFVVAVAS